MIKQVCFSALQWFRVLVFNKEIKKTQHINSTKQEFKYFPNFQQYADIHGLCLHTVVVIKNWSNSNSNSPFQLVWPRQILFYDFLLAVILANLLVYFFPFNFLLNSLHFGHSQQFTTYRTISVLLWLTGSFSQMLNQWFRPQLSSSHTPLLWCYQAATLTYVFCKYLQKESDLSMW